METPVLPGNSTLDLTPTRYDKIIEIFQKFLHQLIGFLQTGISLAEELWHAQPSLQHINPNLSKQKTPTIHIFLK